MTDTTAPAAPEGDVSSDTLNAALAAQQADAERAAAAQPQYSIYVVFNATPKSSGKVRTFRQTIRTPFEDIETSGQITAVEAWLIKSYGYRNCILTWWRALADEPLVPQAAQESEPVGDDDGDFEQPPAEPVAMN